MTDVILVSNTYGDSLKVFIDGETKYIVKKTYRAMSEEGPVDTEEFTDDYRDVSGVKNSFHIVIHRNGEQYAEITLSKLTINAEVDESLFER
jgi:outer membrane lipoprotein-sorting protein